MQRLLAFALKALFFMAYTTGAWALSDDACRDRNGLAINSRECIEYRKANPRMSDIDCFNSTECRAQREAAAQMRRDRSAQEDAAEREAQEREQAASERKAAALESAKKTKCGADYKKPSIGMTMDRVRECVSTSFKEAGQTNTAQGVVTTYRAPGGYLHVIDGRVVQWGKF